MQNKGRLLRAGFFGLDGFVSVEFKDLHVLKGFSVDDHSDEGDLLVEARIARCSRVDVEQVQILVVDYL